MSERSDNEREPVQENLEDQKYRELLETMDEEDRIMKEINTVFTNTPNRAEAEKIVLEKWALLMDEAMKKSREALNAWFNSMDETHRHE